MSNISLYLRLALATGLVLAPGWALARALGVRSLAATLAWSLTLLFGTLAFTFLLQSTLTLTLSLLAVAAVAALSLDLVHHVRPGPVAPGRWLAAGGGAAVGILLWSVAGTVQGDGLFHLARVRKLLELDELSLGAVAGAQVAIVCFAPGNGGAYPVLSLPATSSRQLLVPAALALAFAAMRSHSIVLYPHAADTVSVSPGEEEVQRAFEQYPGQLDVRSPSSYSLAPEVFSRAGPVVVAALLLIPLAGFAARRRWAAFVVGGSLAVFAAMLIPLLFTTLADAVSISQARRAGGFLAFAVPFCGGARVLSR